MAEKPMSDERREEMRAVASPGGLVHSERLDECVREIDRLRAERAKLPTTEDGAPVWLGDEVYWVNDDTNEIELLVVADKPPDPMREWASWRDLDGCYSTEAAAIKAQKENSDG